MTLPMDIEVYYSKEDKNKVAFMYGPVVLAGALGTENFPESDILEDHLKLNHYPGIVVPTLVSNDKNLKNLIKSVDLQRLEFETESIGQPGNVKCRFIPFYEIHHERYTIYWKTMSCEQYKTTDLTSSDYQERLEKITIDSVNPNDNSQKLSINLFRATQILIILMSVKKGGVSVLEMVNLVMKWKLMILKICFYV